MEISGVQKRETLGPSLSQSHHGEHVVRGRKEDVFPGGWKWHSSLFPAMMFGQVNGHSQHDSA